MIKVCFLTHNLKNDNGAGVFSNRLVHGMREKGYRVTVLTSEKSGGADEKAILYPSWFNLLLALPKIRSAIRTADIVHALDVYPYGVIAALCNMGLKKKFILTAVATGAVRKLDFPLSGILMRFAYQKADTVVAISEYTKKEILKRIPGLKILVIHHGVDYDRFQMARNMRSTQPSIPYIVSVGSLRYRKGYDVSIAAFAKIKDQFPNLQYIIVGKKYNEAYFKHLQKLARDLGVAHRVVFKDTVDQEEEFQKIYGGASLFILTPQNANNDFEGFGLVFLEAAAVGLPIVGTKESGIEEAVQEGRNALLVAPGDVHGAAEALSTILKNQTLQTEMGNASVMHSQKFLWEFKINEYIIIYKKH